MNIFNPRRKIMKKVIGVFETSTQAINAIHRLKEKGYNTDDISVIAKSDEKVDEVERSTDVHTEADAASGAGAGAVTGGILGGIGGLLVEAGVLLIPGVGPFIAAGPILTTLTGIVAGGAAGGLVGALVGMGIDKTEAKDYEGKLNEGKLLVLVDTEDDRSDFVYDTFTNHNTMNTQYYPEDYRNRPVGPTNSYDPNTPNF